MSKLRSGLTYANVMATMAIFLALGGGAYAAFKLPKDSVGSKQLRADAVKSSKVKDGSLLAGDFKAGQLPQGARGQDGTDGHDGAPGSPAASAFSARIANPSGSAVDLYYGAVTGISSGITSGAASVTTRSPNATIIARDLSVHYAATPFTNGTNAGYRVTLLSDGTPTALACEFRGAATTCDSGAATATLTPGSGLAFKVESLPDQGFHENDADLEIGWRATTP
jgi:hypothetical protein